MRLIINGKAAGSPELRAAVKQLRDRGQEIETRVTWEGGDATHFAQEALSDAVDTVAIAGGDGTINEVVSGLMQVAEKPSVAVGVVPFGTANDFASGCGIPVGDPLAALELIASTAAVPIDVGCCNDRYFLNVASGGFGAEVTASTPPEMKRVFGGAAYSLMGLVTAMKMSPYHARLILPDGDVYRAELFVVAVGNGRQAGGGFQLAPNAILNDGLLDVMGIIDVEVTQLGTVFSELADLANPDNKYVHYAKLSAFRIEVDEPLQMNLDGEPIRDTGFAFRVLPGALRFVLPSGAPLDRSA
jgi:lipid kinase YegS